MDFVCGIEVFGDSRFWGTKVSVLRRVAPPKLCSRRNCTRGRALAKEFGAELTRGEGRGARNPAKRAPTLHGWGEIEESVPPRVTREGGNADEPRRRKGRPSGRTFLPWKEDDAAKRGGGSSGNKTLSKEDDNNRKKREASRAAMLNHNRPSCYGCGALLQTSDSETAGYVPPHTFELKRKHHQLRTVLCGRCRLLSQGRMIPAVGGVGRYDSPKSSVTAEQLRAQLSHLRHQKVLVVKLVDIVDFNGSFLGRVRDLVGANPIILVLTKVDLLPERTDLAAVSDWLQEAVSRKGLNVISIHLTSSKAHIGISRVTADITRQRQGRDVYILGSANVGKSAFVTALLKDLGRRDPVAAAALRFKPVQSAMPGTTLGPIAFEAFAGGGKIYDTPGVHLHHRMAAALDPRDVSFLAPRRRLRGYVVGSAAEPEGEEDDEEEPLFKDFDLDAFFEAKSRGRNWWKTNSFEGIDEDQEDEDARLTEVVLNGYSLFWGGIARIDVVKAPDQLIFTFYGPTAVKVHMVPTEEADTYYQENVGKELHPPTAHTVEQWGGLEKVQEISLVAEKLSKRPAGDVAISGLGWFTIGKSDVREDRLEGGESLRTSGEQGSDESTGFYNEEDEIIIVLHTPKSVEIFVRPSMPLGKKAAVWYEYVDLSEEELLARPRLFF